MRLRSTTAPHYGWIAAVLCVAAVTAGPARAGELEESIALGVDYLLRHQQDDGSFVYRTHLDDADRYARDKYNLLRHAGTLYALHQAHQRKADPKLRAAVLSGAKYLQTFVDDAPRGAPEKTLAIWSDYARLNPHGRFQHPAVKLGGQGLGLVALSAARSLDETAVPLETLRGVGRCVRWMQRPDGSFRSKYVRNFGFSRWVSLYYPGEAALGMVRLYGVDPDEKWLHSAAAAMGYLARTRKDAKEIPSDHWALIATSELLPLLEKLEKPPVTRAELLAHAGRIAEQMLAEQITAKVSPIRGAFRADGTTTPTAIRLEGLLAMLPHFEGDKYAGLRKRIRAAAGLGAAFLQDAQVREGKLAGGIPRSTITIPNQPAFNRRTNEIRIDYVQHAISAMIGWERLAGQ